MNIKILLSMLFLVMYLFSGASTSRATDAPKTTVSDWSILRNLRQGEKLRVVTLNGKKHTGEFTSIDDSSIIIQTGGEPDNN